MDQREQEILDAYAKLGLATADQRGAFFTFEPKPPMPNFNVVISASSNPSAD